MMKKILLFSLTLIAYSANAQFNIDQSYVFAAGDNIETYLFDTIADEGAAGANQNWDFTAYVITPNTTHYYTTASTTDRLNADLVVAEIINQKYYKLDGNKLLIAGEVNAYGSGGDEGIYSPARQVLEYPLQYNVPQTYHFKGDYNASGSVTGFRKGQSTYSIDGYGQISLPNNQKYNNVVRVKSLLYYEDSISATNIFTNQEVRYTFYAKNVRLPLAEFQYRFWKNGNQIYNNEKYFAVYGQNKTTGIADEKLSKEPVFYPNPVAAGSIIQLNTSIRTVEIYNTTGAIVQAYDGEDRNLTISLNPGLYIVKTTDDQQQSHSVKLFVK